MSEQKAVTIKGASVPEEPTITVEFTLQFATSLVRHLREVAEASEYPAWYHVNMLSDVEKWVDANVST